MVKVPLNQLKAYHYDLPEDLIAKFPKESRGHSRLMVIERAEKRIEEIRFDELPQYLESGDRIVLNNTKVIPARLYGRKESGGQVELLLLEQKGENLWASIARPARKLKMGTRLHFSNRLQAEVIEELSEGVRLVKFASDGLFWEVLAQVGKMPLPPYLQREELSVDRDRYQTVYAKEQGAVAAPTAGLHFTESLLKQFRVKGVEIVEVTLHVGLGTFRPVVEEVITRHAMHEEAYFITKKAADRLNKPVRREICVGTTSCRVLESAINSEGHVLCGRGATDIFIYPGYQFKRVNALLTNFHLPCSTLLMLVSAFAGHDLIMDAYKRAVSDRFRFFSYGDAMLII